MTERPMESGAGPKGLQMAGYGQLGYSSPQFVNVNLARWLQAILWSYAVVYTGLFLAAVAVLTTFNNYVDARSGFLRKFDRWQTAEDVFNIVFFASLAVLIALITLVQVWSFKSHKASGWLWPRERKWSRGWSVGAWWIPLANFLLVPMVLTEVFKIASGSREGYQARPGWALGRTSSTVVLWFVFGGLSIASLGFGAYLTNSDSSSIPDYRWGVAFGLAGTVLMISSTIIAIAFVRDVSRKLAPVS